MELLTQSEENYLKAIYMIANELGSSVSTNVLAERMDTKPSSVTDMVKKLSDKKLIDYQKYQGCSLTDQGLIKALLIVRKHRLWEVFLVEKLKFGWEEVHVIAEQLEHIQSVKLTNQLDDFLGNPKFDPHGDPIPTREGVILSQSKQIPISDLIINDKGVVIGVEDGSKDFFTFLKRYEIELGTELKVIERFSFDDSILVELNGKEVNLSSFISSKIYVQKEN